MGISLTARVVCDRCPTTQDFNCPFLGNPSEYYETISKNFEGFVRTVHGLLCKSCYTEWQEFSLRNSAERNKAFREGSPEPEWVDLKTWMSRGK